MAMNSSASGDNASMMGAAGSTGWGGVAMGAANMYAASQKAKAARNAYKAQAAAAEQLAKQEADSILRGADDQFKAFSKRGTELQIDAARILEAGGDRAQELRHDGVALVSSIKANAAAHGIRRSGSPMEVAAEATYVMEQQAGQVERDAGIMASNKLYEARQLQDAGLQNLVAASRAAQTTIMSGGASASLLRSKAPTKMETMNNAVQSMRGITGGQIAYLKESGSELWSLFKRDGSVASDSLNPYGSPRGSDL